MEAAAKRKALTAAFVNSVKEPGKYHDGKGMGLLLLVKPSGSKSWVQRLTIRGRRREIGLGSASLVTLAEARDAALENKRAAIRGGDPIADRDRVRKALTFEEAARETHKELAPTWKNPKDRAAFLSTMETYIFPRFGRVQLPDVTSADIRQAILAAREKAPGVAKKLTYRVSSVFKWGIAEGHCVTNPAVTQALALPRHEHRPKHRKALHYNEVSSCLVAIDNSRAWDATKLALHFLVLTAARSGEVRAATWDEIDLEGEVWEVPAERMKAKRTHRVPLSTEAKAVLLKAKALKNPSNLIFPSQSDKALSDMTLSKLVKELGFDADVHGFRTSFRTWAQEQTDCPAEVAEAALAHVKGDRIEAAYARSDLFERRRDLMAGWARQVARG
ncbi:MAG: integrase arm-type DNA-binding domain-containing protein [Pseudomonadota bacterium]